MLKNQIFRTTFLLVSSTLITTATAAATALAFPLIRRRDPQRNYIHRLFSLWARGITASNPCWILDFRGLGNLPSKDQPVLFVCNHRSRMDAILLYCLKTQFRLLADDLYFLIPGLGWALTAAGHIKIDGGNILRRQSGLERAKKHLLKGIPVLVFPEGKCTQDAGTAKFNESFLRIAIECDCPIVPITLHNTEKLLGRPPVTPQVTRVVVQIHQQIETRGLKSHALTEQVRRIIETKLGELSTETASYC